MAKTEDLLDHSGEDECPVCRAFDLAYDVVIPALAAWENHYGLKEGQLGLATVLTAASALLEAELADRDGLQSGVRGIPRRGGGRGGETADGAGLGVAAVGRRPGPGGGPGYRANCRERRG